MRVPTCVVLVAALLCGCAQRYKVTLHNHHEMSTSSRPKFDKATQTYRFNDSSGRPVVVPGFRVKEIEPL